MSGWRKSSKILLSSLLLIFIILVLSIAYFVFSYKSWEKDFEKNISSENLVQSPDSGITKGINEKIESAAYLDENTSILELTPKEVSYLILDSFQQSQTVSLCSVYIQPIEKGRWNIFLKVKILNKIPVWVESKLRKEERETAEVFFEDILIGNYSLKSFGLKNFVDKANNALSSALVTAEENGFVGRTLKNVELLDSGLIVRLERY